MKNEGYFIVALPDNHMMLNFASVTEAEKIKEKIKNIPNSGLSVTYYHNNVSRWACSSDDKSYRVRMIKGLMLEEIDQYIVENNILVKICINGKTIRCQFDEINSREFGYDVSEIRDNYNFKIDVEMEIRNGKYYVMNANHQTRYNTRAADVFNLYFDAIVKQATKTVEDVLQNEK